MIMHGMKTRAGAPEDAWLALRRRRTERLGSGSFSGVVTCSLSHGSQKSQSTCPEHRWLSCLVVTEWFSSNYLLNLLGNSSGHKLMRQNNIVQVMPRESEDLC
jgi:hypothetical protein